MSSSKLRIKPSYHFPEQLWSQILKTLPVKYVLRCSSVQKSWYDLIKTPLFLKLHSDHHKAIAEHDSDHHPEFLFFLNMRDHLLTLRFDDVQCQEYATLKYPVELPNHAMYALANGLICLSSMFNDTARRYNPKQSYNLLSHGQMRPSWRPNWALHYDPEIYLWNPLVQKYKTLPSSPTSKFTSRVTYWRALAFGFLPELDDYVVVHIVKPRRTSGSQEDCVLIAVYSLNTNSWKEIRRDNCFISSIYSDGAVFVGGSAYWVGASMFHHKAIVMCFDTKTYELRVIKVPHWFECIHRIHPFGQSIACFVEPNQRLHMWVLKKDDDHVDGFYWEIKIEMKRKLSDNVHVKVLGVRNNGEPIFPKFSNLVSFSVDKRKEYDFAESCDH